MDSDLEQRALSESFIFKWFTPLLSSQFVFQLPLRQWKSWFSIILVETGEGNFTWQWKKQPFEDVFPLKDGESNNFSTPSHPGPFQHAPRGWLRNNEVPKGKVSAGPYRQLGPSEVRQPDDAAVIFLSVTRVGLKKKNVICRFVFEGSNRYKWVKNSWLHV